MERGSERLKMTEISQGITSEAVSAPGVPELGSATKPSVVVGVRPERGGLIGKVGRFIKREPGLNVLVKAGEYVGQTSPNPPANPPESAKKREAVPREVVEANAKLSDEDRLKAAEKLLGPLSEIQKQTFRRMHEVGLGERGAEIYKYSLPQIEEKIRIGREAFTREQYHALIESGLAGVDGDGSEKTPSDNKSVFQKFLDTFRSLERNLRTAKGESRQSTQERLELMELEVDKIMNEANDQGMFAGLDLELDSIHQRIFSHHQPSMRLSELNNAREQVKEQFKRLTDRFQEEYSDEEIQRYLGAQEYYLQKGLSRIENSLIKPQSQPTPEKGWEWKLSEIDNRRLEDELAARANQENAQKEQKNKGREITIKEFVLLKNVLSSQDQIERYIQARYQIDIDKLPKDQQERIRKEIETRIQKTPPKLREIGDEAWRNFQTAAALRNYAQAKKALDEIESLPEDQQVIVYQQAKKIIDETPEEQQKIANEILGRRIKYGDKGEILSRDYAIGSTLEFFIKEVFSREEGKLFRLATNVIRQEEATGIDQTNYFVLNEALIYVEKMVPEAQRMGVLDPDLKRKMLEIYAQYRKKILENQVEPDFRSNLKALAIKMMGEEEGWWDDHMQDRGFTQEFRDKHEGMRGFYVYRGIQRILDFMEGKTEYRVDSERGRIIFSQMLEEGEEIDKQNKGLIDNRDKRQEELEQLLQSGRINQEQYAARSQIIQDLYLREVNKFIKRTVIPGELTIYQAERDIRDELARKERNQPMDTFWDRSWGSVYLTGQTPDQIVKGVENFLAVVTSDETNFDPQRYIEDGTRLGQEILNKGRKAGMELGELNELVARSEAILFMTVAQYFALRWHVQEWHQIASLIGRHIDTRLNAVSKAHGAEVMHAADILDNDEDFDKFGRPARFASEKSSENDEIAKSERDMMQRRLEVRIAFSRLKDIETVTRENFVGIENVIDSFGFDRNGQISATELFKKPKYLEAIKKIDEKLKALNRKSAQNLPITNADNLTPEEKQLLILDRIRPYSKTEDLVVSDQTDKQFRSLYIEGWQDFNNLALAIKARMGETQYNQAVKKYLDKMAEIQIGLDQKEDLDAQKKAQEEFQELFNLPPHERMILQYELLQKYIAGDKWMGVESAFIRNVLPKFEEVKQAVGLAIKTRDVFFISAEKACASLKTNHDIPGKGEGELLSYNDVLRFNKFVRERAIASLPADAAKAITAATRSGQGLMYVDIADKLEFRGIARQTLADKGSNTVEGLNAQQALDLISFTEEEAKYATYVQAVELTQEKVLEKLKELGSDLTVNDIDSIIEGTFRTQSINIDTDAKNRVAKLTRIIHKGETQAELTYNYRDIINREDADPQYNFSMIDDQKYSSLLLSDETKAAAYNPDHPYYLTIPATVRRVLDPDGADLQLSKLKPTGDADEDRTNAARVMETQRRFHFAVDSVKVFGAWYKPDPYSSDKEVKVEYVENIRNSPFIGRRMIEQRFWTLWNRGQSYRGRGFLKYLESNFRGLDHTVGKKGLRGVTAAYNGFSKPKGYGYDVNFSGSLDELKAEHWLEQAKSADAIRPVLVGGQVGQDPNFEGLFKKIVKTIGRNSKSYSEHKDADKPPLARIRDKVWDLLNGGDYEKAISEIEDRWGRVVIYGQSLGFVGNTTHISLSAKFSGDTAIRRMAYWAVAHPEAASVYGTSMDLISTILTPLRADFDGPTGKQGYFGKGATLLTELMRRAILVK